MFQYHNHKKWMPDFSPTNWIFVSLLHLSCYLATCNQLTTINTNEITNEWEGVDHCAGNHTCDAHAQCINLQTTFACQCLPGYSGDGKHCTGTLRSPCFFLCFISNISCLSPLHLSPPFLLDLKSSKFIGHCSELITSELAALILVYPIMNLHDLLFFWILNCIRLIWSNWI